MFPLQFPSDLTEESEPVDPGDPIVRAGVRNLERCRSRTPGTLASHYGTASYTRKGDDERISPPSLGFFVNQPRTRPQHLSDGSHLRVVERREERSPAREQVGQCVLSPIELLENLIGRNEIARSNGSIEPSPEGQEYVWRMVSADVDPDTRVNHVRRRHTLSCRTHALDSPCDIAKVLQTDAQVLTDVCESDPLSIEGLQDETRVPASVVPYHDPKERREAFALARPGRKGLVLGEILRSLAFVEGVGRAAQDQEATEHDLATDGELLGESLERLVTPLSRAAQRSHHRVSEQGISWHQNGPGDAVAIDFDALVVGPCMATGPKRITHSSLTQDEMGELVHQRKYAAAWSIFGVQQDDRQTALIEREPTHLFERNVTGLKDENATCFEDREPSGQGLILASPASLLVSGDSEPRPRLCRCCLRIVAKPSPKRELRYGVTEIGQQIEGHGSATARTSHLKEKLGRELAGRLVDEPPKVVQRDWL